MGSGLHNANRYHSVEGQPIVVSPLRATLVDSRLSCRDAIVDAIARLQACTGSTEFTRRDIAAEVCDANATFERQSVYRSLRWMAGRNPEVPTTTSGTSAATAYNCARDQRA